MSPVDLVFYTSGVTLVLCFMIGTLGLANRVATGYGLLVFLTLTLLFVVEGWPERLLGLSGDAVRAPSYIYGILYAVYGFWLAYQATGATAGPRWMGLIYKAGLAASGAASIITIAPLGVPAAPFINLLMGTMIIVHIAAAITWRTHSGTINPSALFAALTSGVFVAGLLLLNHLRPINPGDEQYLLRVPFALSAISIMGTITYALFDLRRAHEAALEERLTLVTQEAEQSQELLRLERAYSQAQAEIIEQTQRLADVTHDLRQPIASMRSEIDASTLPEEPRARLSKLADHLYALSDSFGQSSLPEVADEEVETIDLSVLLRTLRLLFGAEAGEAGARLIIIPSRLHVRGPATAVMRMVSNLISNAITHASANRILVGAKRRGTHVRLIVADDGRGMSAAELENAFARGHKGEASPGSGLGLSITKMLAERCGFSFTAHAQDGAGVMFIIDVPRTDDTVMPDDRLHRTSHRHSGR
ncbi:MAG: HAMP domain-containing sensor histidine kinase [Pseudomonadota bacterium]